MRAIADVLPRAGTTRLALLVDLAAVLAAAGLALPAPGAVAAVLGALLAGGAAGLYRERLVLSVLDDLPALALAALAGGLVAGVTTAQAAWGAGALMWGGWFAALCFATTTAGRTVSHAVVRTRRLGGRGARPVLVVGAGAVGRRLAESLLLRGDLGLRPVGMVDHGSAAGLRDLPLPLVGDVDDLPAVMAELGVSDVVVAFADAPDADLVDAVRRCLRAGHGVYVVPRLFEVVGAAGDVRTEMIRDLALVRLRPSPEDHGVSRRVLDALVAGAALVVLAPVVALLAAAVRIETGARPLVRRTRAEPGGTHDRLVFRTLRRARFSEEATSWRLDEGRVGPVGRFLRRTGLEELPRLLDTARGGDRRAPSTWWPSTWAVAEPVGNPPAPRVAPAPSAPGPDPGQRRAATRRR